MSVQDYVYDIYSQCQMFLKNIGFIQSGNVFKYKNFSMTLNDKVSTNDLKIIITTFSSVLKMDIDQIKLKMDLDKNKCIEFGKFVDSISDSLIIKDRKFYSLMVVAKHMTCCIQELIESEIYDNSVEDIVNQFFNIINLS